MPRFLVYCPDYPDQPEVRTAVRPAHLEMVNKNIADGTYVYGGPFLPPPGSKYRETPPPAGIPNYAGSFMVYEFPSLEICWDRIKSDPYYTNGVWDTSRVFIEEITETYNNDSKKP